MVGSPSQASQARPPIRGVLFDLGGTLLHQGQQSYRTLWAGGLNGAAAVLQRVTGKDQGELAQGLAAVLEQALPVVHRQGREVDLRLVLADYAAACGVPAAAASTAAAADLAGELLTAMYHPWREHATQIPGAVELLRTLRAQGLRVGVLSNSIFPSSHLQLEVEKAGLAGHTGFVISSADLGWRKPHPRAFDAALERLGLPAAEVVFVGDRLLLDVKGARAAGLRAVLLGPAADTAEAAAEAEPIVPDAEIGLLSELPGLLRAWGQAQGQA